jgi:O-succinylbenzoate synthase
MADMTGSAIQFEKLNLALTRPLVLAGETLTSRSILRVTVTDELGRSGQGDISPLPGLHRETVEQALAQVQAICDGRALETLYPTVQLGLDMAKWQMTHEKQNGAVKLNALVWGDSLDQVEALLGQGYECLKVKVGRDTLDADIHRVQQIKEKVRGRASVRLDANRTWSLDQAVTFAQFVGSDQIDYIEEPTADYQDQAAFFQMTGMPYAWDESLIDRTVHDAEGLAALVIKPACIGSLEKVDQLVTWAKNHDRQAVLSSVFESSEALIFYARYCLAHGLEDTCHGLDTWRWLDEKTTPTVKRGQLIL